MSEDQIINPTFHLIKSRKELFSDKYMEYRNKWENNPKNFVVGNFPIHLDIELNTTCNLKCPMCFQSNGGVPKLEMPILIALNIINEARKNGVYSIKLNYRGEPLCYTHLLEVIHYARANDILEIMLNTNGTLLNREFSKGFIECGLDLIIITIDGIDQETYGKIRVGGNLSEVVKNVITLQGLKQLYKSTKPLVRVQMVKQPTNAHQVEAYKQFWINIADEVSIVDIKDTVGFEEDLTPLPEWYCSQLWQRLFILADGDVVPCCRALTEGKDKLFTLGNIHKKSLKSMWQGRKLTLLRVNHKTGLSHMVRMCQLCGIRKEVIRQNG